MTDAHPMSPTPTTWHPPRLRVATWLGGALLLLFATEVVTGILLLIYYRPTADAAYLSIAVLNDEVRLGWVVRAMHWWSADLLIFLGAVHMSYVYFTRAYQRPRRFAWVSGVLVFTLLLGFGFTGTLLPWDQYAYWSVDSTRQTIAAIPMVGSSLVNLFWGGWELGGEVLSRFYAFHVGVLPWLAAGLVTAHLVTVWRSGLRDRLAVMPADRPILAIDIWMVVLLTVGVLLTASLAAPPLLMSPADPLTPLPHVQPRWYFLPARLMLRHLPGALAALAVLALFVLVIAVPVLDGRERPSALRTGLRWLVGVGALAGLLWMAVEQYLSA